MKKALFVTGTDTGVGKTVVSGLLLRFFSEKGIRTITQKWVQTGNYEVSEDILEHMKFISHGEELVGRYGKEMSPYIFKIPVSPHLAAAMEGEVICSKRIKKAFFKLCNKFDCVIAEGSGGLMVPINAQEKIVDIAESLGVPTVIVAENRLGIINQALLTIEALKRRNISIAGIVFNRLSDNGDSRMFEDNKVTVGELSGERVLGEILFEADKELLYESFIPIGEKLINVGADLCVRP